MRTIALQLSDDTRRLLHECAQHFYIKDTGLVEDVYSLIVRRGAGLPDEERREALVRLYMSKFPKANQGFLKLMIAKRASMLKEMCGLPYFVALTSLPGSPVEKTDRFLGTVFLAQRKRRQSQCQTCNLKPQCSFGTLLADTVTDITLVFDPDFEQKVHEDCPVKSDLRERVNLSTAMQQLRELAQEEMLQNPQIEQALIEASERNIGQTAAGGEPIDPEDTGLYMRGPMANKDAYGAAASHSAAHYCRATERLIEQLSLSKLVAFELASKLSIKMQDLEAKEQQPTSSVSGNYEQAAIKSEKDVASLVPSQLALPDAVFDAKLNRKQLVKIQHTKPDKEQELYYLLIDSSGSMDTEMLGAGSFGLVTRGAFASAIGASIARRMERRKGLVYLRFYDTTPSKLYKGGTADEFKQVVRAIRDCDFNGANTNTLPALTVAVNDIESATEEHIAKAEILLITDGVDHFKYDQLKTTMKNTVLRVILVSHEKPRAASALQKQAKTFLRVNTGAINIDQLLEAVIL